MDTFFEMEFKCTAEIRELLAVRNATPNYAFLLRICTLLQCIGDDDVKGLQQRVNYPLFHEMNTITTSFKQVWNKEMTQLLFAFSELYTEDSFHLGNQIRVWNNLSRLVVLDYRRLDVQFLCVKPNTHSKPSQAPSERVSSQYELSVNEGGRKDRLLEE